MQYAEGVLVLVGAGLLVLAVYAVGLRVGLERRPLVVLPFTSGAEPAQHAWSRYHVRWYPASLVFLAFDVEMLFMYPWAAVLPLLSVGAVVEMFAFLAVVMGAVVYAWREGAFRWT